MLLIKLIRKYQVHVYVTDIITRTYYTLIPSLPHNPLVIQRFSRNARFSSHTAITVRLSTPRNKGK